MTPHIECEKESIAPTVIMAGDPLRVKLIAENYLEDYKLVSKVRNMYVYTGYYKNKKITIFSHGMGIPSMGIYSYELFKYYGVENIIRVGTAGSYSKDFNLRDIVLAKESFTHSTYSLSVYDEENYNSYPSKDINRKIGEVAYLNQINIREAKIYSSDAYYTNEDISDKMREEYNCDVVEMETFSLFLNAEKFKKKASAILTITDSFITNEELSSVEREKDMDKMIKLALETALTL